MIRLLGLGAALLSIGLFVNAGSASARTGGTFVPNQGSGAQIQAVASALNLPQGLAIMASPIYTGGDVGNKYGDGDGKNNGGSDDHTGPDPTPEPTTILSFGAALLIGGGVIYSRRLRRNRK
jgi:hypothetical protein